MKDEIQMISKVGFVFENIQRMHGIILFHVLIFVFEHVVLSFCMNNFT
jgi:hypothetical protein